MLKREIKFEDFDGNQVSEIHYFNISKPEIIKLEAKYPSGFGNFLQTILEAKNNSELVGQFDEIILMAYGEKTDDGRHFEKSEELKRRFSQSAAYNQLFMELATEPDSLIEFVRGVFPKDVVVEVDKASFEEIKQQVQTGGTLTAVQNPPTNLPTT